MSKESIKETFKLYERGFITRKDMIERFMDEPMEDVYHLLIKDPVSIPIKSRFEILDL